MGKVSGKRLLNQISVTNSVVNTNSTRNVAPAHLPGPMAMSITESISKTKEWVTEK